MLPLLALPAIAKAIKSPLGRKVLGKVGNVFKKKGKRKVSSVTGSDNQDIVLSNPVMSSIAANAPGIAPDKNGIPEVINDILGRSTKDLRNVSTEVKPLTIGLVVGGLALLVLLATRK